MKFRTTSIWLACIALGIQGAYAQVIIRGEVRDLSDSTLMSNVNLKNIYTQKGMTIGNDGQFQLEVKRGELIEFSCIGYQTARVRIHSEKEPVYYRIYLEKTPIQLREVDIRGKALDFKKDSIRFRETYDLVLRKPRKQDIDMRSMPLAMLSRKNRQEWAFQAMYEAWEEQKYIDFTFNERLVSRITYLKGEELSEFMRRYRPSYQFLREASDYEYLSYIKDCYIHFKKNRP